jgi:UDP-N-acetylmuramate dehydrogenase
VSLLFLPEFNLQPLNTLAVPATARFYVSVDSEAQLIAALAFARERALPLLVLGGGSNIVLRGDFPGLVLHIRLLGKTLIAEDDDFVWLEVAAGENWHSLVEYSLEFHYWGLENLSLIPGTVGAAPIQNIGAYGVELKDVVTELRALEISSAIPVTFTAESCGFGYRDSIFKQALKDQYIITSVMFKLRKEPSLNLAYPALQQALTAYPANAVTPMVISETVCNIRRSKLPNPEQLPNVGSFFKNPVIPRKQAELLRQKWPDLVTYPIDEQSVKVAAGWLIDRAGWRGYRADGVAVHDQQALVLTNEGRASGEIVLSLARKVIESVREMYGIELEPEPRIYP